MNRSAEGAARPVLVGLPALGQVQQLLAVLRVEEPTVLLPAEPPVRAPADLEHPGVAPHASLDLEGLVQAACRAADGPTVIQKVAPEAGWVVAAVGGSHRLGERSEEHTSELQS